MSIRFQSPHHVGWIVVVLEVLMMCQYTIIRECTCLHLQGSWDPEQDFFLFLSKFGFQKTELANKNNTQGFIFGNVTGVEEISKDGFAGGGRISRLPSIPPAALIPKSRVPRSLISPVNNSSSNNGSNDAHAPKPTQAAPSREGVRSKPKMEDVLLQNTSNKKLDINFGGNSINRTASVAPDSSPAPSKSPSQIVNPHPSENVFSETFVQLKSSPQTLVHVNFSNSTNGTSSASNKTIPNSQSSSAKPRVFSSSTTSTTTTRAPVVIHTSEKSSPTPKPFSTASLKPSSSSSTSIKSSSVSASSTTSATPAHAITPPSPSPQIYPATLVVLDRGYFLDFYKNRLIPDRNEACRRMFERISLSLMEHDPYCNPRGTEHLLRRVPCTKGGLCPDDQAANQTIVKNHQFTYAISDPNKAKFWYISMVPCYRDPNTCEWQYSKNISPIEYDIFLVNGNPYMKNQNPLEYQFSFDRQDTVEIYLVFFVCYLILVPLQIHAVLRQRHIVPKLFTASVALELTAVTSNVVHVLKFAVNGKGHPGLAGFGDIADIIARAIFMLILLVLAKGWAVTRTELTSKPFIFSIWAAYGVVHILLYVWKETEVDVIEDIDEYQTWPGWLILILRTLIMIWFLYELKDTMDHEHQPHKLNFFLHFGAAALVWFIYLPIVALIALQVSPLWRSKFLLGITYSADCLAFAIMTHLLWPTRTEQYFLLMSKDAILTDELEEFNEAPHVVNNYVRRPNQWYPVNYSFHEVSSPEAVSLTQGQGNNTIHPNLNNQYPHHRFANGASSSGLTSDDVKDNVPLIIT